MILHVLSYMPPDNQEAYIGLVWFGSLLVALGFLFFAGLGGAARLMYDRRRANRK